MKRIVVLSLFVVAFVLSQISSERNRGVLFAPPDLADGFDYDNIGFNLARGKGFSRDFADSEWQKLYRDHNTDGSYNFVFELPAGLSPTTNRPVLYPALLAGIYRTLGRNVAAVRIFNATCVALAVALAAVITYRFAGTLPALFCLFLGWFDKPLRIFAGGFLTEGVAALLVALLAFLLTASAPVSLVRRNVAVGCVIALLILLRNLFALWVPLLLVIVWQQNRRWRAGRAAFRHSACCMLTCFVLLLPWMVRNCGILGIFMPLGSQAGINAAVDYSDEIIETGGQWNPKIQAALYGGDIFFGFRGIGAEREAARLGEAKARTWIRENWRSLPRLFVLKISSVGWRNNQIHQKVFILLALLGIFSCWRVRETRILTGLLVCQMLAVGLTHDHHFGRFLMPIHPVLYVLASIPLRLLRSPAAFFREANNRTRARTNG